MSRDMTVPTPTQRIVELADMLDELDGYNGMTPRDAKKIMSWLKTDLMPVWRIRAYIIGVWDDCQSRGVDIWQDG